MRVPKRKSEEDRMAMQGPQDNHMTKAKLQKLKDELVDIIENQRPKQILEVQRTQEMGDLSENAAYQEAKHRLRRMNTRILTLEERIKNAVVIESGPDKQGRVKVGSIVTVWSDGKQNTYEILGSQESDPFKGRISHVSPIGEALIGKQVGEQVEVAGKKYEIVNIE